MSEKINFTNQVNHSNLPAAVEAIIAFLNQTYLNEPAQPPQTPNIVNNDLVCQRLGISLPTLIRWRQKGKIPFMQIGSAIRYDLNKVIAAIEVGKKKGAKIWGSYHQFQTVTIRVEKGRVQIMSEPIKVKAKPYINGNASVTVSNTHDKVILEFICSKKILASDEMFTALLSELLGKEVYNV